MDKAGETQLRFLHTPFNCIAENRKICKRKLMKTMLTVTDRGTITLPAKLRRQLGIKADDQLIAEATPEGLLLRPAVTLPLEIYSDARIAEFDAAEAELGEVLRRKRLARRSS
jgi:AbrB family looped-hinge helix DNA binding protein